MKNAVILHGTANNSQGNWFPWLQTELEKRGYNVWTPDLPITDKPNNKVQADYVLKEWEFNEESLIIGHSAGTVVAMTILQNLPENVVINKCILVSALINDLGWDALTDLFTEPLDYTKIKPKAQKIILISADNDPYIGIDQPQHIAKELNAQLIIKEGQGHFNLDSTPPYKEFPFLLELI